MAPSRTESTIVVQKALGKLDVLKRRVVSNTDVVEGTWTDGTPGATAAYQTEGGEDILAVINPPRDGEACKSKLVYPMGMEEEVQKAIEEARIEFENEKAQL